MSERCVIAESIRFPGPVRRFWTFLVTAIALSCHGCGSGKEPIQPDDPPSVVVLKKAGANVVKNLAPQLKNQIGREADLTGVKLAEDVLSAISQVPDLTLLRLTGPHVTDETLARLGKMPDLATLDLSESSVTDAGLAHLVNFPGLATLHLTKTQITTAGIRELQKLRLSTLAMNNVAIGDDAVEELVKLQSLRALAMVNNEITPSGVERLKAGLPNRFLLVGNPPKK